MNPECVLIPEQEANKVIDLVESWQSFFNENLGRVILFTQRMNTIWQLERDFPAAESYGDLKCMKMA